MKRKDVLILLVINIILTNIFAYLDYGDGFGYLTEMWGLVLLTIVAFMVLPLLLLFFFRKSKCRLLISCIGFVPLLLIIGYLLF